MSIYTDCAKSFGTVAHGDMTLALTQQAYPDNYGTDGGVRYYAHAMDKAANVYKVEWDTTQAWDDVQAAYAASNYSDDSLVPNDDSSACNWDKPADVRMVAEAEAE